MRRLRALAGLSVLLVYLSACAGDAKVTAPDHPNPQAPGPQATPPTPGLCISFTDLYNQVSDLFLNGSPDQSAGLGKLNNLNHQVENQNFPAAKAQAFNLVDFILKKYKQGSLVAPASVVISTVNNIFCFAGLALEISSAGNTWIVYPTDNALTLITDDGLAGTTLPGHVVDEPTLIGINRITDVFAIGDGPLPTNLDQYPLFFHFTQQSENNHGFLAPVIVGVCPANGIEPDVLARLRLGHGIGITITEITPLADASFLNCVNAPTLSALEPSIIPGWLRGFGEWLLPQKAYAFRAGGGVGGSAEEFSPFAPVDPALDMTGGVGGSAGEFLKKVSVLAGNSCPPVQAPQGGAVDAACRPEITIETGLGTKLTGVPVDFSVETGGGSVAPETAGVCGTFGSTATVNTDANGKARVCWTLGDVGGNSVRARPRPGGDALDETYFTPPSFVFNATANPPVQLAFVQQPGNTTAGSAISPSPTVAIQDANGVQVPGATQQVSVVLSSNSFTGTSTTQVAASGGLATFSNLVITKAGNYTMTASATLANGLTSTISQSFTVSAAAASLIQTFMPPGPTAAQTFGYGTGLTPYVAVSPAPQAIVTDQYGNTVGAGTPVYWSANTSNGSLLSVGAGSSTGAGGTAQVTSWTLGEGLNQLFASLYPDATTPPAGFLPAQFTASTPTGQAVFACGVGTSKIDLGPMTIPAPNSSVKSITLQMSITGQSNAISAYQASLSVRLDGYNGQEVGTGSGVVSLPGNNGSPTPVTLHLAGTGVPRQTGSHTLWFRLTFSNLPATRKIQVWYNASFPNSSPCKNAVVYSSAYPTTTTSKAGLSITATN